jgi:hypothetical protein
LDLAFFSTGRSGSAEGALEVSESLLCKVGRSVSEDGLEDVELVSLASLPVSFLWSVGWFCAGVELEASPVVELELPELVLEVVVLVVSLLESFL